MTLAMIARADDGGLGALTWEAWRHLQPTRTLVVHTAHHTRGRADTTRYDGDVRFTRRAPRPQELNWLFEGATSLYTAETWYTPRLPAEASRRGIRTVLHAMPEMGWEPADLVLAPTSWRLDMLPDAQVLPVPIARDRLPYRQRDGVDTLYHIASNAFHDRNGTDLVLAALEHMRSSCRLLIRNPADVTKTERIGPVHVEWVGHHHGPYYEWPDVDLFVLPRRFAGLCLPMQEAFSLGVPVVTLDIAPQNEWPASLIPAHRIAKRVHMKGGPVDIYGCDPEHLAARIDHLISNPDEVADLSARGDAWAETLAWEHWTDTYRASL